MEKITVNVYNMHCFLANSSKCFRC